VHAAADKAERKKNGVPVNAFKICDFNFRVNLFNGLRKACMAAFSRSRAAFKKKSAATGTTRLNLRRVIFYLVKILLNL
jgi:hypothetical protein